MGTQGNLGFYWENQGGRGVALRLETKLCDDLTGESANHLINDSMIRMIKESPSNNRNVRFKSSMCHDVGLYDW